MRGLLPVSIVTAAVLATAAFVSVAAPPLACGESVVRRQILSNGMTVLVQEESGRSVVAAALHVRFPQGSQTPDSAGLTNFLHRAMLRGTERRSFTALAEAAEEIGGTLDASAEADYAEIRGAALASHWATLLGLIAEVALQPTLAPEEIERERRLILSQIQTRADTPPTFALDTLLRHLYGSHPYAWPSSGVKESIERIEVGALRAHYREIYRPERLILAVVGGVPGARVVRAVERLFSPLRAPRTEAVARAEMTPVPPATGSRRVIEKPAQQAQVLIGYVGPRIADPDYAAVKVLSAVVGGGMSGRLFFELRDKRGLAYSIGVTNPSRSGPAPLFAHMGTGPGTVDAAEQGLLRELERIRVEPPSETELARAKGYILGNLALDRRTVTRRAWYLAFFEGAGVGWDFPDRYARDVAAVTVADVQRAAERYFRSPTVVVLQPARR